MEKAVQYLNAGDVDSARPLLADLAEAGEARAAYYLAVLDPAEVDREAVLRAAETVPEAALHAAELVHGDLAEAERHLRTAAAGGIHVATFNLGTLLRHDGQMDRAKQAFEQAGEAGVAEGYCSLGDVLQDEARYPEAHQAYRKALGVEPRHVASLFNVASMLEEGRGCCKDEAEAERRYEELLDTDIASSARCNLGRLQYAQGRVDESVANLELAGTDTAKINLASVLFREKRDRDRAVQCLREVAEGGNEDAKALLARMGGTSF